MCYSASWAQGCLFGLQCQRAEPLVTGRDGQTGRRRRKALDDAHRAGILSEQEYQSKKAELEAA